MMKRSEIDNLIEETVIAGEVSDVNDDANDNCYLEKVGRFPSIVEDVLAKYYLCTEYPPPER